ncbi:MAG TPA: AI-2E family transporter [Thermoanaerobaculia bacterium]|nr:AI-2E family transporter [Thermoanaerobaculia bacterium]HQR68444.1 AI-2E family transporter [Thermoanaerobaculia bacterium]
MISPPVRARTYAAAFFVVLLACVAVLSVVILAPFFSAIAWAIVLAVAIRPLWVRIERRFPTHRSLAAAGTSLLVALVVLLPAAILGTALATQAVQAAARFGGYLRSQAVPGPGDLSKLPGVGRAFDWLQENAGVTPALVRQHTAEIAGRISGVVAAKGGGLVAGFFGALGTFLLTLFLLFFFLRDGEAMAEATSELLPLSAGERRRTMRRLGVMLESIFKGSLLTALVQGVLGGIGWALAGLPSPVLAGAAMAVFSLLPIGGTAFVWLPAAAALAVQGRTGAAVFLFLWGAAAVGSVDNFLKPLLIKGGGELTTLVVFLGVFGGIAAFGLLGVFIGPIVLAAAQTFLETLRVLSREAVVEGPPTA